MKKKIFNILLVEDEETHAELVRMSFEPYSKKYKINVVETLKQARAILKESPPDLVIADMHLPDGISTELLPGSIEQSLIPFIIVTGYGDERAVVEVMKKGALDYVPKSMKTFADMPKIAERALREWLHIVERRHVEKALRESEKKYRKLVESSNDWFWACDKEGILTFSNRAINKLLGYTFDEIVGESVFQLMHPDDKERVQQEFLEMMEHRKGWLDRGRRLQHKDGSVRFFESTAQPIIDDEENLIGFSGIDRDITKRSQAEEDNKRLETQLRQAHKMEAIGTMAGGIAHDFNNILAAIIGYTELLLSHTEPGSMTHGNLKKILKAGERARDLVNHILTFSRQSDQEIILVQITPIIKEVLKFIRASLPTTIEIRQKFKGDPTILADPTQIHQVIMNLCTNAAYAMRNNGGVLELGLESLELSSEFTDSNPGLKPGIHVKLTVSDNGYGFSSEFADRIFEPFFTTKEKGDGTGMGLAVVHGIVLSHGGIIKVNSKLGKGSVFTIFFPASERRLIEEPRPKKDLAGGAESILFVDDEAPLVELSEALLGDLGYKVTGVTSSVEALEIFKNNPDQFDLVITDMTMPKITGDRLAGKMLKIKSDIPIILCTGFSATFDENKAKALGIRAFIHKPLLRRQISETIRNVLDNK